MSQRISWAWGPVAIILIAAAAARAAGPNELNGVWLEQAPPPSRDEHPGLAPPPREPTKLVIDRHLFVVTLGDRTVRQSLLRLIPGTTPKAADLTSVVGDEFSMTRIIYRVEGDVLTICEAFPKAERPVAFERFQPNGDQVVVRKYRRAPTAPKVAVGQPAPAVDGLLSDGSPLDPKDLAGKVVLYAFWSADDAARERQFAALRAVRQEFRTDQRFRIVSVRLEGEWNSWLDHCARPLDPGVGPRPSYDCDPTWWQVFHTPHSEDRRNPFGAGPGPEAYLVGPDGKLLAVRLPDDRLRDAVAAALTAAGR